MATSPTGGSIYRRSRAGWATLRKQRAAFGHDHGIPHRSPTKARPFGLLISSSPVKAGFGEVDIVLDATQDFVVDRLVVAQGDDGLAFRFQCFAS